MGLVDDQHVVVGQHDPSTEGQVAPVQVMVDDDDVGIRRRVEGSHGKAVARLRAFVAAGAFHAGHRDALPQAFRQLGGKIVPIPRWMHIGPLGQQAQVLGKLVVESLEGDLLRDKAFFLETFHESGLAEVVLAALHDSPTERDTEAGHRLGEERQVLLGELVLEALGGSGDDHLLPGHDGRNHVAERLAGPWAGLTDEVRTLLDRLGDGTSHLDLADSPVATGLLGDHALQGSLGTIGWGEHQRIVGNLSVLVTLEENNPAQASQERLTRALSRRSLPETDERKPCCIGH
ncbi:hypothetical protein BMS3Bbin01_01834 [bacterium BMS3Bbin01]|nr:hypothetical protein BMS3Bbin01_01834 [bacterium BMS3Bbin01]